MRIIIDAMGGDNAPREVVKAAVRAVNELDIDIILVGQEEQIKAELSKQKLINKDRLTIQNATEIITNDDAPAMAIKTKKDSSMVVGLNLLKDGAGDALICAGNTGAQMAGGLFILKRIKGVDRPALAPILPTKDGAVLLIDAGANAECESKNLTQFAVMGSIYMKKALGIENPRVGLVNIGTEEKKGNDLTKQAYDELKEMKNINFIGNIEGRDILEGVADVVVCDGFVGNVILKVIEGMGSLITRFLKEEFTRSPITKLGAMISASAFKNFKKKLDYKEYGGAVLIGIDGTLIKVHGSADERLFFTTIKQAKNIIASGLVAEIQKEIAKMEE